MTHTRTVQTCDDIFALSELDESGCWIWTGAKNSYGYGDCVFLGKRTNASRAAWILKNGEPTEGMVVCHSCDNPVCVNPDHLWLGTQGDNVRDCVAKGRCAGHFVPGAAHPRPCGKLSVEQVRLAKKLHFEDGISQSEIGRRFGVHSSTISRAVRGEYWSHA